ncbi:MAG: TRAP transporter small permease [Desulfobacterales bacterium]
MPRPDRRLTTESNPNGPIAETGRAIRAGQAQVPSRRHVHRPGFKKKGGAAVLCKTVCNLMDRCVNWCLALLMAAMVGVISAQVWCRFVLNDPLAWSEEAGRYLFVWISFMGAAAGVRYQVHLGIDLLQKFLPDRAYRLGVVLVNLIIQIFLLVIVYWGFKILEIVQFQESASLHISMRYPYLAVPVGGLLMLINSLRVSVGAIRNRPLDHELRV